ncbi:hypothetical protein BDR26DRAFT_854395 [Obelidium mucronatum]|nr:hypothetical protein BDR26DRAFT_854395 [Obelidium mucronatum]
MNRTQILSSSHYNGDVVTSSHPFVSPSFSNSHALLRTPPHPKATPIVNNSLDQILQAANLIEPASSISNSSTPQTETLSVTPTTPDAIRRKMSALDALSLLSQTNFAASPSIQPLFQQQQQEQLHNQQYRKSSFSFPSKNTSSMLNTICEEFAKPIPLVSKEPYPVQQWTTTAAPSPAAAPANRNTSFTSMLPPPPPPQPLLLSTPEDLLVNHSKAISQNQQQQLNHNQIFHSRGTGRKMSLSNIISRRGSIAGMGSLDEFLFLQ